MVATAKKKTVACKSAKATTAKKQASKKVWRDPLQKRSMIPFPNKETRRIAQYLDDVYRYDGGLSLWKRFDDPEDERTYAVELKEIVWGDTVGWEGKNREYDKLTLDILSDYYGKVDWEYLAVWIDLYFPKTGEANRW